MEALRGLEGKISEEAMLDMNAEADIQKIDFAKIAAQFSGGGSGFAMDGCTRLHAARRASVLVGVSLLFSVLVGIPLE